MFHYSKKIFHRLISKTCTFWRHTLKYFITFKYLSIFIHLISPTLIWVKISPLNISKNGSRYAFFRGINLLLILLLAIFPIVPLYELYLRDLWENDVHLSSSFFIIRLTFFWLINIHWSLNVAVIRRYTYLLQYISKIDLIFTSIFLSGFSISNLFCSTCMLI